MNFKSSYSFLTLCLDLQVDLQNIKPHALETALDFIYTGQLIVPTPEHATKEQLAILLNTLQVLGLDMSKLDGCEIKFKR